MAVALIVGGIHHKREGVFIVHSIFELLTDEVEFLD